MFRRLRTPFFVLLAGTVLCCAASVHAAADIREAFRWGHLFFVRNLGFPAGRGDADG